MMAIYKGEVVARFQGDVGKNRTGTVYFLVILEDKRASIILKCALLLKYTAQRPLQSSSFLIWIASENWNSDLRFHSLIAYAESLRGEEWKTWREKHVVAS